MISNAPSQATLSMTVSIRLAAGKCVVRRDRGENEAEPAERAGDEAGAHGEHVEMHEDAIEHPGHDDFGEEHQDKWRTPLRRPISGLFGFACSRAFPCAAIHHLPRPVY